jgi:HlyD family secretion protein
MRRTVGITILVLVGLAVIGGAGMWWLRSKRDKGPTFHTVPVKRGALMATISATGTVEPEAAVDIGAQVAGVIIAFGKDQHGKDINWGSVVEAGTVLAKIDDSLYTAAVDTAKAQY